MQYTVIHIIHTQK